ncbi:MAG TPA: hypothetical protein VG498_08770, partial [Terriglobales bacterium]|nr:hypothetical protein [Terriglobales bacterium]
RDAFPADGAVARLTNLGRKLALMRIRMAVDAMAKLQTGPARFSVGAGCVTLHTSDVSVRPSERVASLGMIKPSHQLPIVRIVTLCAFSTETALMRVFVAGNTGRGKA